MDFNAGPCRRARRCRPAAPPCPRPLPRARLRGRAKAVNPEWFKCGPVPPPGSTSVPAPATSRPLAGQGKGLTP